MWPRAGLLAAIVALVPLPAAAGPAGTQAKAPTLTIAMQRMVARDMASAPAASSRVSGPSAASRARQTPAAGRSGFFKTRPGIVALVVMAAGTGYAVYSATHDRIHSAGKQ